MEPLSFQGQGLLTVHTTWQTPPAQNSVALPHHCFCVLCASLARFWGMSHRCRYKWLTDSKAAISKVTFIIQSSSRPRRYPDNIDLDTAIRELHQSLGGRKMKIKWVRGHQDDRTPYEELPSEAKLNIDSDSLASDHYWSGRGTETHRDNSPFSGVPSINPDQWHTVSE
jgi:ribonuclease HI